MGRILVQEFITQDYQESVQEVLQRALQGQETANFEFPLHTKNGARIEILLNATPRRDEHGRVIGVVGIGQDITARIAQEREYVRLIDTANAPIFGVDERGLVNVWNQCASNVTGFGAEDVMGRNLVQEFITVRIVLVASRCASSSLRDRDRSERTAVRTPVPRLGARAVFLGDLLPPRARSLSLRARASRDSLPFRRRLTRLLSPRLANRARAVVGPSAGDGDRARGRGSDLVLVGFASRGSLAPRCPLRSRRTRGGGGAVGGASAR